MWVNLKMIDINSVLNDVDDDILTHMKTNIFPEHCQLEGGRLKPA
jgi:hypothetical protein